MTTGRTRRVSVSSTGAQANGGTGGPAISADGRHVAFASGATNLVPADTNNAGDTFVRDMATGQTRRISVTSTGAQANGDSYTPTISADGRYVAFATHATNLVPPDTIDTFEVFVHDVATGRTRRVSVTNSGAPADSYSGGGGPKISADGRHVAFESAATNLVRGDTNGYEDVFLRHLAG